MIETILTSTVIAGIVAAAVAFWTVQKKISIENITHERRKWREKVREKTIDVHNALIERDEKCLNRLKSEFTIILNPEDDEDRLILDWIKIPDEGDKIKKAEEFTIRIALLLKHDWERTKLEAGSIFFRLKVIHHICGLLFYHPVRKKYEEKNG